MLSTAPAWLISKPNQDDSVDIVTEIPICQSAFVAYTMYVPRYDGMCVQFLGM